MYPVSHQISDLPSAAAVLFIEDHVAILEHGCYRLKSLSPQLKLITAMTGSEGLALARINTPDVVLLDLSLPDCDGLDLIPALRAGPKPPAVVVYTARNDDATLRRLEAAGVAGVLWKGFDAGGDLAAAVQRVLAGETHVSPYFIARIDAAKLVSSRAFSHPAKSNERIVVVKSDRLRADGIVRAAREVYPEADITLCRSAAEAIMSLRAAPAALGLVGLMLPDMDGLDFLARAGRERWFDRIMVVSGRKDERTRQSLREAQIDGFFDIAVECPSGLVAAIRQVAGGGAYFSPGVLGSASVVLRGAATVEQLLTETELRVFAVVGDGSDDGEAAARLRMGVATVHSHRKNIMRKLGVQTRTKLMLEAIWRGVVRLTEAGRVLTPGQEEALATRAARVPDIFSRGKKSR